MKERVIIDAVRTANTRARRGKGWFRNVRRDEMPGVKFFNFQLGETIVHTKQK